MITYDISPAVLCRAAALPTGRRLARGKTPALLWVFAAWLGFAAAFAASAVAAERKDAVLSFAAAYGELLRQFPEAEQGLGIDRGGPEGAVADQPMTYGLILSAEALRCRTQPDGEAKRRVRLAARWLLDNSRLAEGGKPGWGLPFAWNERPKNTAYTITTAIALEGLLDALTLRELWSAAESREIVELVRQVGERWCMEVWVDGLGGGYFNYSPHDTKPGYLCINAPAMFVGALARFVHEQGQFLPADTVRLFRSRLDAFVQTAIGTGTLRGGAPYWDYIAPPNNPVKFQRPNDLVHQAYIIWGLENYREAGGSVKLPWTQAQALESMDRFWKDGTLRFFAQDEATVKQSSREAPANLWGAGMLLASYARWGSPEQSRRCFTAICEAYGPFPRMRVLPRAVSEDGQFYPRDNAHVLFGLAYAAYGAKAGSAGKPR